jgi:hypothetical protein
MKVTPFSLKTRKFNVKIGEKLAFQSYTLIRTSGGNSLFPVGGGGGGGGAKPYKFPKICRFPRSRGRGCDCCFHSNVFSTIFDKE